MQRGAPVLRRDAAGQVPRLRRDAAARARTLPFAPGLAPDDSSSLTTSRWPLSAAACSAVQSSCGWQTRSAHAQPSATRVRRAGAAQRAACASQSRLTGAHLRLDAARDAAAHGTRETHRGGGGHVGALSEQQLDEVQVALVRCQMQRRAAVLRVRGGASVRGSKPQLTSAPAWQQRRARPADWASRDRPHGRPQPVTADNGRSGAAEAQANLVSGGERSPCVHQHLRNLQVALVRRPKQRHLSPLRSPQRVHTRACVSADDGPRAQL